MDPKKQYKLLLTEIIKKQTVILGPQISVLRARNIHGLTVDNNGNVTSIEGDPQQTLEALVDSYVGLAGEIVKNALGSIFAKYPSIKSLDI